ncbi:hypothetical protein [Nocardia vermiculata]|uniref:DUF4185 domain-containing protein n=1 Tax=Nocardia vermiculata TaxID=257274 RepID=A0A846Y4D8_9NOCA|nr:hypothetical protein [Nocardia vermiculata]NKY52822.1 DUF4185 domain-containing protein [Nocardia vermiculata]
MRSVRLLVLTVLVALALGTCVPAPPRPDAPRTAISVLGAAPLECLNSAFAHYGDSGAGWTGGDSTWSAPLPGNREVFAFSDTFLAPVTAPTRPPGAGFVHNSLVVRGADGRMSTILGGEHDTPAAVLAAPDASHWFWLGAATYLDGALQIPLTEWRAAGAGPLDAEFAGSSLARFAPDDLHHPVSVTPLPRSRNIQWGQWVQPDGAWTYLYGVETDRGDRYLHIARVAGGDLRGPLSVWTGRGWSRDVDASARITSGVGAEFSVHRLRPGAYALISMRDGGIGSEVTARFGAYPSGPFGPAETLYRAPEAGSSGTYRDADVYAYNAHAHPEFSSPTRLVVSYNVNSLDSAPGGDVYRDTGIYRPRFITVDLHDEYHPDSPGRPAHPACR